MPIVSVTRWKISQEDASQIARDIAPLLKQHGASEVRLGQVHTGEHTGQILAIITYPDGETFGRAVDAQAKDTTYQQHMNTARQKGQLLGRTVILAEDIG